MRILVYLTENEGLVAAPEVSDVLQVSYNNVVRVINRLQTASLLQTHTGRYGGMRLALPADQITVRAVVAAIDGPTRLAACMSQKFGPSKSEVYVHNTSSKGPDAVQKQENTFNFNHNCEVKNCSIRAELFDLSQKIDDLLESVTIDAIVGRNRTWIENHSQ